MGSKRESVRSLENTLEGFPKYDKKSFIIGINIPLKQKEKGNLDTLDRLPPKSHLVSHVENGVKNSVLPVQPVHEVKEEI